VRKTVAITVAIIAMFICQFLMHDVAGLLVEYFQVQPATAPMTAYLMMFAIIFFLQSILYRFLTDNYKSGKIVDRVIGSVLGTVEGVIVISVIIFVLTMQGPPSRKTIWDSRLYHPTASVAPRIMDFFSNIIPMTRRGLDQLTAPDEGKADSTLKAAPTR
jgi:uncharacterized membrane protein required for colicin V production